MQAAVRVVVAQQLVKIPARPRRRNAVKPRDDEKQQQSDYDPKNNPYNVFHNPTSFLLNIRANVHA